MRSAWRMEAPSGSTPGSQTDLHQRYLSVDLAARPHRAVGFCNLSGGPFESLTLRSAERTRPALAGNLNPPLFYDRNCTISRQCGPWPQLRCERSMWGRPGFMTRASFLAQKSAGEVAQGRHQFSLSSALGATQNSALAAAISVRKIRLTLSARLPQTLRTGHHWGGNLFEGELLMS